MGSRSWIQSKSGKKLEPLALTVDMVGPIEEIAHSLAGEFRFTRQTAQRYSVAEHCVRGSRLLSPAFAGAFLLHELSEVYLPDIAGPLKPSLQVVLRRYRRDGSTMVFERTCSWADLEREHTRVILQALGLSSIEPLIYSPEVKAMDLAMLAAEKRDLLGPPPEPWLEGVTPADPGEIVPWPPHVAAREFLARYAELFGAYSVFP